MQASSLHYSVTPERPTAHLYRVSLTVSAPNPDGQQFWLPAWLPGSYMIRDFARHIIDLSATDENGDAVAVQKIDKQTWQAAPTPGPLQLEYVVYAFDTSVRAAYLDQQRAFFNGSSLLLAVSGQEDQPCELTINPVPEQRCADWSVATGMTIRDVDAQGFGTYYAEDYDALIDHPCELGNITRFTFTAKGIPHTVVLSGKHFADGEQLCRDLTAICEYELDFFGAPYPFEQYVFLVNVVGNGYGGLEHRNSTALICSRDSLPCGEQTQQENYRTFLGLCSHEYFHSWNVKRIKPVDFVPMDLTKENYTRQLWAYEGITSYYDDLTLLRAGRVSEEQYLDLLAKTLNRVYRGKGRFRQSVGDSSLDAWSRFYKQDENAPNAIVSYYTKGAVIALCLDLTIRLRSNHVFSLDDVMRDLWSQHGQTGIPTQLDTIKALCEQYTETSFDSFFHTALDETSDLPLTELLHAFGIKWDKRAALSNQQWLEPAKNPVALGANYKSAATGVMLTQVYEDEAAEQAGLASGDQLLALAGLQVSTANLQTILDHYQPGDTISYHAFRDDILLTGQLVIQAAPMVGTALSITKPELAQQWLSGETSDE